MEITQATHLVFHKMPVQCYTNQLLPQGLATNGNKTSLPLPPQWKLPNNKTISISKLQRIPLSREVPHDLIIIMECQQTLQCITASTLATIHQSFWIKNSSVDKYKTERTLHSQASIIKLNNKGTYYNISKAKSSGQGNHSFKGYTLSNKWVH